MWHVVWCVWCGVWCEVGNVMCGAWCVVCGLWCGVGVCVCGWQGYTTLVANQYFCDPVVVVVVVVVVLYCTVARR